MSLMTAVRTAAGNSLQDAKASILGVLRASVNVWRDSQACEPPSRRRPQWLLRRRLRQQRIHRGNEALDGEGSREVLHPPAGA